MDVPPEGYTEPVVVYLVEFGDEREPGWVGQRGGFTTEAEAERLRQHLIAKDYRAICRSTSCQSTGGLKTGSTTVRRTAASGVMGRDRSSTPVLAARPDLVGPSVHEGERSGDQRHRDRAP